MQSNDLKNENVVKKGSKITKRERFVKVAEQRTTRILQTMDLLGNCANKSNYEYTDEDVKKIMAAIENEFKALKAKFAAVETSEKKFKL